MGTYNLNGLDSLDDLGSEVPHPAIIEELERHRQGNYQRLPLFPSPPSSYERIPPTDISQRIPKINDNNLGNNIAIIDM
ncbi:hypothetical protein HQ489_01345 [Candidatus Woesearchaeota archaeon]|nr:hypothetical protein [Candidatus Woesearchaeota archaeon]